MVTMTRVQWTTRTIALASLFLIPVLCFAPTRTGALSIQRQQSLASRPKLPARPKLAPPKQGTAQLQAAALKLPTLKKESRTCILSAASFIVMDVLFRRIFAQLQISFPSSLGGCGFLFATLLALPTKTAQSIYDKISPGAALLAKWLPIFFVPSLVTLPLAQSMGSAGELAKIAAVVVGGFFFTLLTTAGSVVGVRKLMHDEESAAVPEVKAVAPDSSTVAAEPAPKAFSDETFNALALFTGITGIAAIASRSTPVSGLFLLGATLQSFVFGARLDKKITKVVHPLVICTALSWATMKGFGAIVGDSFRGMLQSYRTGVLSLTGSGPGDLLLFMLGPAVVSLAVSMYDRRQLMKDNLAEVGTAVGVSTIGGVFGTALAVRMLALANPAIRLGLLSRNITSPLAMAIASILGADISLAVSFVVVTGLIGANFGASILDAVGIQDAVARGLGIGAAAHGLGTAAFANEKDAFPFAAIAMALTASAATVTVSIPFLKRVVIQLALGP